MFDLIEKIRVLCILFEETDELVQLSRISETERWRRIETFPASSIERTASAAALG